MDRIVSMTEGLAKKLQALSEIPPCSKLNVLVVEDNDHDAYLMNLALKSVRSIEVDVTRVVNGEDALSKIRASQDPDHPDYNIVLLDMNLPGVDGMEVFEEIRRVSQKMHVILVTGSINEDTIRQAMTLGYFGVIGKPLTSDDAKNIVAKHSPGPSGGSSQVF